MEHDGDPALHELIEAIVPGMVTGWTLLVTYLEPDDGEPLIYTDSMKGQTGTTTLGHAQAIVAVESARIVRNFAEGDD
jgi:hypothetical protein